MADEKMLNMNDLTEEQLEMISGGRAEIDESEPRWKNILRAIKRNYTKIEDARNNAAFFYAMFRFFYDDLTVGEILDYIEEYWDSL